MSGNQTTTATRVLIADAVSDKGVELLRDTPGFEVTVKIGMSPDELRETISEFDGLVVRSATKVTSDVRPDGCGSSGARARAWTTSISTPRPGPVSSS